jgi:hypothetical protein
MRPMTKMSPWALTALLAVLAAGCSGTTATSHAQDATSPASSATPKPPPLPNPFEITARYSAASLGLKRLTSCHRGGGVACTGELAIGPDGNLYVTNSVTARSPSCRRTARSSGDGDGPATGPANSTS